MKKSIRIGFDARAIPGQPTGIGWYSACLLKAMVQLYADGQFFAYTHAPIPIQATKQLHHRVLRYPRTVWLRSFWERFWLPWAVKRDQIDVWHSPLVLSLARRRPPSVVTIHDVGWIQFPSIQPAKYRAYWTKKVVQALQETLIITPSHATRHALVELFDANSDQITVIPEAADPYFWETPPEQQVRDWLTKLRLPKDYFLYVGTLEPRKNTNLLLDAFLEYYAKHPDGPKLVIVGGKGWLADELMARIASHPDCLLPLGYLPQEGLRVVYRHALAFLLPSVCEGFGLPALEAMASGAPCLLSNSSSLPEIAGNAAMLLDCQDASAWVRALEQIVEDANLRADLSARGVARARQFSWERAAQETLAVYQQALDLQAS